MSQDSNFLGGSFSNSKNVRAPIQSRAERGFQNLKRLFSSRTNPPTFTSKVIRPVKPNKLSFSSINQQATSCPRSRCVVGHIKVQKPTLDVAKNEMPNHSYS